MWSIAPSLRPTTEPPSPPMICWTNAPRWVRRSAGRSQSATAISEMSATPATPISPSRRTDTRLPAAISTHTATPRTNDGTPPKSAPQVGQPSPAIASRPYATHTAAASLGRRRSTWATAARSRIVPVE
ncbi:hypothetical protein GCM10027612_09900 [Microbispora bryophytorum subsp. camponoti]